MPPKKATAAGAKKIRRKEKKNVAVGQAYIKSTFNHRSIWCCYFLVICWPGWFQGKPQEHTIRCSDGCRSCCKACDGTRHEES
jgi:hypothetical protein